MLKIKRVLLIYPANPKNCILNKDLTMCEPLGLEYIASAFDQMNCDVDLLDARFETNILSCLKKKDYDLVGVAYPFTTFVNESNKIIKVVKKYNKNILVIIGGHHPTVSFKYIDFKFVDYIVGGEGCGVIKSFCRFLKKGKDTSNIDGLIKVKNGVPERSHPVVWSYDRNILNEISCPMRSETEKYRTKFFHASYKPMSLIRFSVGCPFNCNFCVLWRVYGRRYITRTNNSILNELLSIKNKYIYVVDDEAFLKKSKMLDLARRIIEIGFNKCFYMYVRADTITKNPMLIETWAKAGLVSVLVGFETVDDKILSTYNKRTSLGVIHEASSILHNNGINIRANFIVHPNFSELDFSRLSKSINDFGIDLPTFTVLTPFFGTLVYDRWKSRMVLDDPELFDAYHSFIKPKLGYKTFYKKFADLFRNASYRNKQGNSVFYYGSNKEFKKMVSSLESGYKFHYSV